MIGRIVFSLSSLAALAFSLSKFGVLDTQCLACAGTVNSAWVALAGSLAYGMAVFLPQRAHGPTSSFFAGVHGLLLLSLARSGEWCWFCAAIGVVAITHALWQAYRGAHCCQTSLPFACTGIVLGSAFVFSSAFLSDVPTPDEVIETHHFPAQQKNHSRLDSDVAELKEKSSESKPVLVKVFVRPTCGYCMDFKSITLPDVLENPDLPPFTVQYINAPSGKPVPFFEFSGSTATSIRGLLTTTQFVAAIRQVR